MGEGDSVPFSLHGCICSISSRERSEEQLLSTLSLFEDEDLLLYLPPVWWGCR